MRRSVAIKKMHYIQFTIVKWTFDPYTCVIFQCSEWFYILFSHFLIPHIYKEHYRSKKTTTKNFAQKVLPPMCETTVQHCPQHWWQLEKTIPLFPFQLFDSKFHTEASKVAPKRIWNILWEEQNPLLWRAKSTYVFMEDHYDYTEGHSLYIYSAVRKSKSTARRMNFAWGSRFNT